MQFLNFIYHNYMEKKLEKWSGIIWRKKGEEGGEIERVRQYRREIKRPKRINWDRGIKRKSGVT
jgi:hypothetical protein